ncbi:hypothetical protein ALP36_101456 [Pseudomonas syringae pv. coriandricola]|uniref:HTH cro/C1-type domain-containing protein n=3 Tax=Pseudomonas syringae group genomosp. 3 TaxID=251701 RepID=A0A3M5RIC6_9PSED|nr:hypothetical protein ALP87_101394 [Pseudomonas syringae pv. coriandricola]RMU08277.1 hypothetical protein ALP36_101456 [Pseudomonas syringae pv. coriandricola]
MEWNCAMWLYPRLWMLPMPLKESLAAVLRLSRSSQSLSQEDFHGRVESRHMSNIEHAKSGVTLTTLENLAIVLDIDPVALLVVASSYDKGISPKEFLKHLAGEISKLEKLGVLDKLDGEFKDGQLDTSHPRVRSSWLNKAAVLKCKAEGKTQKETVELLGLGKATVSRLWKDDK